MPHLGAFLFYSVKQLVFNWNELYTKNAEDRKMTKEIKKVSSVYLEDTLKERIKNEAKKNNRSFSAMINLIINKYFKETEK